MRFCSLASSSKAGSAYLIQGGEGTKVLVDCGLGVRRLESRLREAGVAPDSLAGVLATHDHSDHVTALRLVNPFTRKFGVPLYGSPALLASLSLGVGSGGRVYSRRLGETIPLLAGKIVRVGGLTVLPFRKSHDAPEPLGYLITDGEAQVAVATDLGAVDAEMIRLLRGTTYLIFESNHDVDLEIQSGRPLHLIQRVLSDRGHLSNEQAGDALAEIAGRETRMILLAHLSDECNTPELAYATVAGRLQMAGYTGGLGVAPLFERSCSFTHSHTPRLRCEAVAGGGG
jgi:phosphoribosyl 1,2-cyclic phosphodiesterase